MPKDRLFKRQRTQTRTTAVPRQPILARRRTVQQANVLPVTPGIKYTPVNLKRFPIGSKVRLVKTGWPEGVSVEGKVGTLIQARRRSGSRITQVAVRIGRSVYVYSSRNLRKP